MKMDSSVPKNRPAAELTRRSVVGESTWIRRNDAPIDVNLDVNQEDEFIGEHVKDDDFGQDEFAGEEFKRNESEDNESEDNAFIDNEFGDNVFEDDNQFIGVFNTTPDEKKSGATLVVMACITVFLFVLAGISVKFSDRASNLALLEAQSSSGKQLFVRTNDAVNATPAQLENPATNSQQTLSDILLSRISLVSSNNPKFVVTAAGRKIVANDIIGQNLQVVDIFNDHILVSSNGVLTEISY